MKNKEMLCYGATNRFERRHGCVYEKESLPKPQKFLWLSGKGWRIKY